MERTHLPPRMPTRITVMSDYDGSPQRDDRHHRQSRSSSPSPRDTRRGPSRSVRSGGWRRPWSRSGQRPGSPGRPPATTSCWRRSPRLPKRPPPPLRPQPLPSRFRRGPVVHRELRPRPRQAAPRPRPITPRPLACRRRGGRARRGPQAPRRGPPQPQRGAGRAPSTAPTQTPATPIQPSQAVPPQGRLP